MNNQLLATMVLFDSELRDEVFMLMNLAKIKNYTQFVGLYGSSEHGKKQDNVAWPGSNEILFVIATSEQFTDLKNQIEKYKQQRKPAPGIFIMNWKIEEFA